MLLQDSAEAYTNKDYFLARSIQQKGWRNNQIGDGVVQRHKPIPTNPDRLQAFEQNRFPNAKAISVNLPRGIAAEGKTTILVAVPATYRQSFLRKHKQGDFRNILTDAQLWSLSSATNGQSTVNQWRLEEKLHSARFANRNLHHAMRK